MIDRNQREWDDGNQGERDDGNQREWDGRWESERVGW